MPTTSLINAATDTAGGVLPVGSVPNTVTFTPNGEQVYVANCGSSTVSVIDTASNRVIKTLNVGSSPSSIAFTPDGSQAFVGNRGENTVSAINTKTYEISTLITGNGPQAIVVTPDGTYAYVANFYDNTVSVINTKTHTVNTIEHLIGTEPSAIAITRNGKYAYVTNFGSGNVSVIKTSTNRVVNVIPVGACPFLAIITTDDRQAFIANDNSCSVINIATQTAGDTILLGGKGLNSAAITPDGKYIYFTNFEDKTLITVDTATHTPNTHQLENHPSMVAIAPDQAPLAAFTSTIATTGRKSTFDASASLTPTGTIINYFWDFGDGQTLNTPNPSVDHIFTEAKTYKVMLTVTNSAGTSNKQIISYYSFTNDEFGSYNMPISNNGGPAATTSNAISVLPSPPQNFKGCRKRIDKHRPQFTNILTWDAPSESDVTSYKIFRNQQLTDFVAEIRADQPLMYEDNNRKKIENV